MDEFDSEDFEPLAIPAHGFAALRAILIATAGFWLMLAWAVWSAW